MYIICSTLHTEATVQEEEGNVSTIKCVAKDLISGGLKKLLTIVLLKTYLCSHLVSDSHLSVITVYVLSVSVLGVVVVRIMKTFLIFLSDLYYWLHY